MFLAFDSTDSPSGGCTTHVALEILGRLPGLAVRGAPRLVRLNPNVPFKTRGNGAVCLEVGHPVGHRWTVGERQDRAILGSEAVEEPSDRERDEAFQIACATVDELRARDEPQCQSAVVALDAAPAPSFYESAVRRLVEARETEPWIPPGTRVRAWGAGRGLIGALAAAAWRPERGTWELLCYRERARWGQARDLDPDLGPRLDAEAPSTFDNWDPRHRHLRLAPRSPCPVLCGIRGTDPWDLLRLRSQVGPETPASWLLFATNQATDDHLLGKAASDVEAYDSPRIVGRVDGTPHSAPGGHVFVRISDATGGLVAAAYEPTKEFRAFVRSLRPGDLVEASGGVHEDPGLLALESVAVLEDSPDQELAAPSCGTCGRRTKSRGRRAGYRCRACGESYPSGAAVARPSVPRAGQRAQVPVLARRHLTRPFHLDEGRLRLKPGVAA